MIVGLLSLEDEVPNWIVGIELRSGFGKIINNIDVLINMNVPALIVLNNYTPSRSCELKLLSERIGDIDERHLESIVLIYLSTQIIDHIVRRGLCSIAIESKNDEN